MNKKGIFLFILMFLFVQTTQAEVESLSHIFELTKGLLDRDGDALADTVALRILIPDSPTAQELSLASDIAARANLESLVVDFGLVHRESSGKIENTETVKIHIGPRTAFVKSLVSKKGRNFPALDSDSGLVSLEMENGQNHIVVTAGSQKALLQTGRAFFLRWPYLWDIWGREEGETYQSVEKDLIQFLKKTGSGFTDITVNAAAYEFPQITSPHDAIKALRFNSGQIKNLRLRIDFSSREELELVQRALLDLQHLHNKGEKTETLSYSGCQQLTVELQSGNHLVEAVIKRVGYPKRILTPSYKSPVRASRDSRDFDLLSLFSPQGLFTDRNNDQHADGLETLLIVPEHNGVPGIDKLASRLVLDTTGAFFPLVRLDTEIENIKSLSSPVLVGRTNLFLQELVKTAKLKTPPLDGSLGYMAVVPKAFNNSSALAITSADQKGMEKTLAYLGQTFPYLEEFNEGQPQIRDVCASLDEFFQGMNGTAEAYLSLQLEKIMGELEDKQFESFEVQLFLPTGNAEFERVLQDDLKKRLQTDRFQYESFALKDNKVIFEKEKVLAWEKEEAIRLIEEKIGELKRASFPLNISIGLSESPKVRKTLEIELKEVLASHGIENCRIDVHSSYKQGFFWITEKMIPLLKKLDVDRVSIQFAEEIEDFTQPKRFYSDPYRWLQELYPVDEFIAKELNIPLEKIEFEKKIRPSNTYELLALDTDGQIVFQDSFSPRVREEFYLKILPEWGKVKLTTGWITITEKKEKLLDIPFASDLERFWEFYQSEILPEVNAYILKKTDNEPSFQKQPYFKRLLIELWLSEPDFRLNLDEELVSSLESIHDEIYFDTLDWLRGITDIELEDESLAEDSSRFSAPGNILPLIHPSLEGEGGRVKVVFEDWQAKSPQLILKWKEQGKNEHTKKFVFPKFKTTKIRVPGLLYNGQEENIERLLTQVEIQNESDYTSLIDIIARFRDLKEDRLIQDPFRFPGLKSLSLVLKYEDLSKEEVLDITMKEKRDPPPSGNRSAATAPLPTESIISPQSCLEIVDRLGRSDKIKTYIAGKSYENREIPVLEISTPNTTYTSQPRLVTFKPTLYLSGRQHANEVSATNYILKFAEILATEKKCAGTIQKVNFILHPLENPDGADLAYKLQELTPNHSLHAGRYTSLGIDVGYQVGASKPLLPEAKVRGKLFKRWLPDIYLNLHGYPSHEWVQQFSNYAPYLFRDYWIPRGWFAYYRSLTLPIYQQWTEASDDLKDIIITEMTANPEIHDSNTKFYDRYFRWAARWQPHMNYLERYDGLNLYAKRRSSRASRLSARRKVTFVEETPELMDETAQGPWLDFLVRQGLTYLWAHVKYLSQTEFEIVRIEEEIQNRIVIEFVRSRPGKSKNR